MNKSGKIWIAGHRGLVGSALLRRLEAGGYANFILKKHAELDLARQADTEAFFERERPEYVFLAAAKVGGIGANSTYPAEFIYENLIVGLNVVHAAHRFGVRKLLNLGSACIFPRLAPQPMKEDCLLSGPLEPTNEAYAVAKIAVIKLCRYYHQQYGDDFVSVMPTNLYGPGDSYDLENSHVLPALIRKYHEGKLSGGPVTLWGDGSPFREFLYSEDLADAAVFIMENFPADRIGEFINIGAGADQTIRELAGLVARVVGYTGQTRWDPGKPNGMPRKILDSSRLAALGWKARTPLEDGIRLAYEDFRKRFG
jgi:GDP-L-fucose synthase